MAQLLFILACVLLPFILMPILWRRMKRTRRLSEEMHNPVREQPWQDRLGDHDGQYFGHDHRPNEDLIQQGAKGRENRWPLDNG